MLSLLDRLAICSTRPTDAISSRQSAPGAHLLVASCPVLLLTGGMCSTAVPAGLGRQSSSLVQRVVLSAGLLAVCVVAVTQLQPLHETAGVLSDTVSLTQAGSTFIDVDMPTESGMRSCPAKTCLSQHRRCCRATQHAEHQQAPQNKGCISGPWAILRSTAAPHDMPVNLISSIILPAGWCGFQGCARARCISQQLHPWRSSGKHQQPRCSKSGAYRHPHSQACFHGAR
jgi:hypothetical protein